MPTGRHYRIVTLSPVFRQVCLSADRQVLSHYRIITLSHYRIITLSHYHIITLSHYHIILTPCTLSALSALSADRQATGRRQAGVLPVCRQAGMLPAPCSVPQALPSHHIFWSIIKEVMRSCIFRLTLSFERFLSHHVHAKYQHRL